MDASIEVRVSVLEKGLDREIEKREKSDKYRHHMAEDIQARYAEIQSDISTMRAGLQAHIQDDQVVAKVIGGMDERLRTVERLVWIAAGGVLVIGAMVSIVGINILRLLAR